MLSVYTTLSLRYLRRRWVRAGLIVLSIACGVALLVATRTLNQTMDRAAAAGATPLGGVADLLVNNGDAPVESGLAAELRTIDGIETAHPRIFANVKLPDLNDRPALLVAINLLAEMEGAQTTRWQVEYDKQLVTNVMANYGRMPVIVGKALDGALAGTGPQVRVQGPASKEILKLHRAGSISARGAAAALGGNVLIVNLDDGVQVVGLKDGQVSRIDLTLKPGANREAVQKAVAAVLAGRAEVRTPEEQNHSVQNVMVSTQVGLLLCGVAALVVGLFLVYNALSVSVTERRHEIGVLRGLGATRGQVIRLFTGEAALLGLAGSLLGIPLGIGVARLALDPMQDVLSKIFFTMEAGPVEVGMGLLVAAVAAGVLTAVGAALVPALLASRERPAEAVRRIPSAPTWRHRFAQVASSSLVLALGVLSIALRNELPPRFGMYAGLGLVVIGALLATPLLTALLAGLVQPVARRCLGIEGRLAADNLVRAPGRTGLVIAALAAGVALVMQTMGIIKSNRIALRDWVTESIASDLIVTAGSPVSAGGQSLPMDDALGVKLRTLPGIEAVLPARMRRQFFRDTQVLMMAVDAAAVYRTDVKRPAIKSAEMYRVLSERPDGVLISENFAILHGVKIGDTIALASPRGLVRLHIVGQQVDYSWNHGTIFVNRALYLRYWDDPRVDVYDVYLQPGVDSQAAQEAILKSYGAEHGLFVLSQAELQGHIDGMIEQFYGIAVGQQVVVMIVAALGVVTALLISVLQRKRELGLLRAIGASRMQVIRSVLAEASLMGVIGTLIGLLVGIPLQWYALRIVILEETGYSFPVQIPWTASGWIAVASLLTATLAGLGPAVYAIRQRIPEAIALE